MRACGALMLSALHHTHTNIRTWLGSRTPARKLEASFWLAGCSQCFVWYTCVAALTIMSVPGLPSPSHGEMASGESMCEINRIVSWHRPNMRRRLVQLPCGSCVHSRDVSAERQHASLVSKAVRGLACAAQLGFFSSLQWLQSCRHLFLHPSCARLVHHRGSRRACSAATRAVSQLLKFQPRGT